MSYCFNSRTHERCDKNIESSYRSVRSFNSRTHEGCDERSPGWTNYSGSFNSRTHEGCDLTARDAVNLFTVSIHAPTRGATTAPGSFLLKPPFQFTHPRGVRPRDGSNTMPTIRFQFTHPRGVRLQSAACAVRPRVFQFTHPRGVRLARTRTGNFTLGVSIHAPTRGATK